MKSHLMVAALLSLAPRLAFPASAPATLASPTPAPSAAAGRQETFVYLSGDDGQATRAPLFAESSAGLAVAKVGTEQITVEDLASALAGAHGQLAGDAKAGKKDFSPVLDRLVETRLLLLEARDMGIYDLPEVKQAVSDYDKKALGEAVQRQALAGVKADPQETERLYQDAVRQWKIRSALFEKEADAKAFVAAVRAGKSFDELAKKAVAEKKAKKAAAGEFLPRDQLLKPVLQAVSPLKKGELCKPFKVPGGFAVLQVEDFRYPDDPTARNQAEQTALKTAQQAALKKTWKALLKRYARTDEALVKRIDFEAKKPGFAALEKDKRVVSRLEGGGTITVGELAQELRSQYYHGIDGAIKEKRVNAQKLPTLDAMLSRRILPLEAKRLGVPESPAFKRQVSEFTSSAVFGVFVEKAIVPDVKVTEEERKKYYDQHQAEFAYPAMYKLESLGFNDLKDAQAALNKLRSGTDLKWLRANAENQVKPGEGAVAFEGNVVAATTMPADLVKLLAGTKKGDWRLYASEKSQGHVIHVLDATQPGARPYAEVREEIQQKLFGERLTKAIKDWANKLRSAHPVKIYLTKIGS